MYDIIVSIVTYKEELDILKRTISSVLNSDLNLILYIVDNSPTDYLKKISANNKIIYIFNNKNVGFAAGHNIVLRETLNSSKYHLSLNPDIYFEKGVLEKIFDFMETNKNIGLILPKILYPDNSLQYLCKLLPTPVDLFMRSFPFLKKFFKRRNNIYELRFSGYEKMMDVPYLSGCFMFLRTAALKKIGFFEEKIFMYLEDADLTRRIYPYFRTVYFPEVSVFHDFREGTHKNLRLFLITIMSSIKYFNKWGWFFDKERKKINTEILKKLDFKN